MASTAKALYGFFNRFGIPACSSNTVPDDAPDRYITYLLTDPEWDQKASLYCQVWDRSTSNDFILGVADQILQTVSTGITIPCDGGFIRIFLENPAVQVQTEDDTDWRYAYINMSLNAFHMPGA